LGIEVVAQSPRLKGEMNMTMETKSIVIKAFTGFLILALAAAAAIPSLDRGLFLTSGLVLIYLLPISVATYRFHPRTLSVGILTVFAGCAVLSWMGILALDGPYWG